MRELTELDYCVLGVIWRFGPMTTYAVRKVFRDSQTASWSSSSGSIYPSIRRLIAAELAATGATEDRRRTQTLTITPKGLDRLKEWICHLRPELATATPDPIRTRAQFLTILSAGERTEFVKRAVEATLDALRMLEDPFTSGRDEAGVLDQVGILGANLELRARLQWLGEVLDMMPAGPGPS